MPTFTAMFEHRADAERMQAELERLGIIDTDGDMNVHDRTSAGFTEDQYPSSSNRSFWGDDASRIPDEDRHTYEEGVRRGHYLLTVNTDDSPADEVHRLLENSNAVDVDEKSSSWRKEGWTAPAAGLAGAAATGGMARQDRVAGEKHIPIVEEQLKVGKREVSRGNVRVRSYVAETPVTEQVSLREEHVDIQRRPVDRSLSDADLRGNPFQEREIEVTETAEEAVVAKNARVVEEVVVSKDVDEHVETVSDTVRRTNVEVEQLGDTRRDGKDDGFNGGRR